MSDANTPTSLSPPLLITVAICTRNRAAFLEPAIRSVLPQLAPDTELLVVDNASTDDTAALCARLAAETGAVGYRLERRLGLSVARNLAVNEARGKFILFLDDDALAEPGWLAAYRNFLLHPPATDIVAVGGGVIPFYDPAPPPWITPDYCRFDLGEKALLMARGGLAGCNSAYDCSAVIAAGFFDPQLGYQGDILIPREESELQDRLIQAGGKCWWLPGAAVRHFVAASRLTVQAAAAAAFHNGRAAAIQRLKTTPSARARFVLRLTRLFFAPFHILINLLQTVFSFALGRQKSAITSWRRVFRTTGWAWQLVKSLAP